MKCPICGEDDAHLSCKHLFAVVGEDDCDGPAGGCYSSFAYSYEGDDPIWTFKHCCEQVAEHQSHWSSDEQEVFGGSWTSFYAKDIDRALKRLDELLESEIRSQCEDMDELDEDDADGDCDAHEVYVPPAPKPAQKSSSKGRALPPISPTHFGGLTARGRVSQHEEVSSVRGSMRAALRGREKRKAQDEDGDEAS